MSQVYVMNAVDVAGRQRIIDASSTGAGAMRSTLDALLKGGLPLDGAALDLHNLMTNDGERTDAMAFLFGGGSTLLDEGPSGYANFAVDEVAAIDALVTQLKPAVVAKKARARGLDADALRAKFQRMQAFLRDAAERKSSLLTHWSV
jgi:hypothetical protein